MLPAARQKTERSDPITTEEREEKLIQLYHFKGNTLFKA